MKKIVFTLILLCLLSGCSVFKLRQVPETSAHRKSSHQNSSHSGPKVTKSSKAVWHLIEPLGLELTVTSMDKKHPEIIYLDKTLSQVEMDPGEWLITGFTIEGKKYEILDSSKHFSFKLKANKPSYSGSLIVQCPIVGQKHLAQMKKMSFFNRLSFKSGNNLCEMVVGNEYKSVKEVWVKLSDRKSPALIMGF